MKCGKFFATLYTNNYGIHGTVLPYFTIYYFKTTCIFICIQKCVCGINITINAMEQRCTERVDFQTFFFLRFEINPRPQIYWICAESHRIESNCVEE